MASIACTPPSPAPGDVPEPRERARGALLGLAVGDALGAPAENLKPSEIRARWGRITGYVSERPCGTDDTEYAIFSGLLLARHGSALTPAHVESAWHEWIADRAEGPFRGAGFSERGTLENLRRGLAAPISAQHRHAWSDGLAMRAAPFGVFAAGRPGEAARLVAIDGSVSHDGEGIYGGQAVAAGVAAAMAGATPAVVIASALAVVPEDSWTARSLRRAVTVAHRGERAVRSAVVIGGYPWTDLAPEAVALAFGAYAAADGDFRAAVLTAVNMGRDADTTAAVAGALSGATQGICAIPADWAAAIGPARGRCLPSMAGHHVLDVAELLVPEEGGKWGAGLLLHGSLPAGVREVVRVSPAPGTGDTATATALRDAPPQAAGKATAAMPPAPALRTAPRTTAPARNSTAHGTGTTAAAGQVITALPAEEAAPALHAEGTAPEAGATTTAPGQNDTAHGTGTTAAADQVITALPAENTTPNAHPVTTAPEPRAATTTTATDRTDSAHRTGTTAAGQAAPALPAENTNPTPHPGTTSPKTPAVTTATDRADPAQKTETAARSGQAAPALPAGNTAPTARPGATAPAPEAPAAAVRSGTPACRSGEASVALAAGPGGRGRSPLVGAGNAGEQDDEGRA
ncbi:ADP-ribosylglycohydrolase family protein [Streptomyces sp. NPDC056580]|uniref:ADP-ribosylglycohydrolase family protein n=1 Tax=Streptomyces sp. NPDC056580 TaxID=3345872 RepID=UPI0036ABFAF9